MLPAVSSAFRPTAAAGLVLLACGVGSGSIVDWFGARPVEDLVHEGLLSRAHQVQPRETSVSIQLALQAEKEGDIGVAERLLLQAAALDHQFLPAWTLTNFYFRRGNLEGFWTWAARSAYLTPHDPRPIVRLAARLESDPAEIAEKLGRRPPVLRGQLDELIGAGRLDAAMTVARILEENRDPADTRRLSSLKLLIAASRRKHSRN